MQSVSRHLTELGLDAEFVLQQLPTDLTLSYEDGVLFICDHKKQRVTVDFLQGALAFRATKHIQGEHLIKACRLKNKPTPKILDATCGMGRDSFLLYQSGFSVTATESNPVVHALLTDGIRRYERESGQLPFDLHNETAEKLMESGEFDVIYLDPMFPAKSKSAKAKKDMQLFQTLHQNVEDNAKTLLSVALETGSQRVVIKRPLRADPLLDRKATFEIKGKTCRFEAYQLS